MRTFVQPHYRKPSAGMLLAARHELGGGALTYIGDMDSDRAAAAAAGAAYLDAAAWRTGADMLVT